MLVLDTAATICSEKGLKLPGLTSGGDHEFHIANPN